MTVRCMHACMQKIQSDLVFVVVIPERTCTHVQELVLAHALPPLKAGRRRKVNVAAYC